MAFYDDSGGFAPGEDEKFACLGMVVVPVQYVRKYGDAWWGMLDKHFQYSGSLQINKIEVKSSELHNMLRKLDKTARLDDIQQNMFEHGLNTTTKVKNFIEEIWGFLAEPPLLTKYLAVVVNKEEVWLNFQSNQFNKWRTLKHLRQLSKSQKNSLKKLRYELESFLVKHAYGFLLQRLDYLSKDGEEDFDFSDAFVVGDEFSDLKVMLEAQAGIQAGLGKFSDLPTIVNRTWFGSSLYDPCLQMADWVAFAVRTWAEADSASSHRIDPLLPCFRGYPDQVLGRGIVCCPSSECFPNLPLEDNW